MTEPVRVALIGNSFAAKVQLPSLRHAGGNTVIGIAGHDLDKARETAREFEIPLATTDYRELLALDPDLVIVSTPVDLHARMVRDALETRAAILCEKPFTLTVAEAEELCAAASGRLALIDHQLRWNPYRHELGRMIREGYLGEPWHAYVEAHWASPAGLERPHSWWFEKERGGGFLGAGASHLIDLLRVDLGEVQSVQARLDTYVRERPDASGVPKKVTADEHARLWLRMKNGCEVTIDCGNVLLHRRGFHFEYWGSRGYLCLEGEEDLRGAPHGEELVEFPVEGGLFAGADPAVARYGPFARCEPLFFADLIAAVARGDTRLPGAATFADGLATQRVLAAAQESAASGVRVECAG